MPVRVFVDFDGTITETDTLVFLLDRYSGAAWREIEDRVEAGTLSEERGLREEIALLRVPWAEAEARVLAEVPADPSFAAFAAWCRDRAAVRAALDRELARRNTWQGRLTLATPAPAPDNQGETR